MMRLVLALGAVLALSGCYDPYYGAQYRPAYYYQPQPTYQVPMTTTCNTIGQNHIPVCTTF